MTSPDAFEPTLERLLSAWSDRAAPAGWPSGATATRDALAAYVRLLLTWGRRLNLTGSRSADDLVARHLPDAFAAATVVPAGVGSRVVDVGAGGGLPGVPLAILRPDLALTLIEPRSKKVAFLRTAVRELGLTVTVHRGRIVSGADQARAAPSAVAAAAGGPPLTGGAGAGAGARGDIQPPSPADRYDVALSRATFPPADWIKLGAGWVRDGGLVLAFLPGGDPGPPTDRDTDRPGRSLLALQQNVDYALLDGTPRRLAAYVRSADEAGAGADVPRGT